MNNDRQQIIEINEVFYRAFEKKNIVAMEEVWSQGTHCICIHPGRHALKGWPSIRNSWSQIFQNTDYIEINVDILNNETNADLGYLVLVENVLQISGQHRIEAQSIATNVFERLGSRWYLVHHHGSPVMT